MKQKRILMQLFATAIAGISIQAFASEEDVRSLPLPLMPAYTVKPSEPNPSPAVVDLTNAEATVKTTVEEIKAAIATLSERLEAIVKESPKNFKGQVVNAFDKFQEAHQPLKTQYDLVVSRQKQNLKNAAEKAKEAAEKFDLARHSLLTKIAQLDVSDIEKYQEALDDRIKAFKAAHIASVHACQNYLDLLKKEHEYLVLNKDEVKSKILDKLQDIKEKIVAQYSSSDVAKHIVSELKKKINEVDNFIKKSAKSAKTTLDSKIKFLKAKVAKIQSQIQLTDKQIDSIQSMKSTARDIKAHATQTLETWREKLRQHEAKEQKLLSDTQEEEKQEELEEAV